VQQALRHGIPLVVAGDTEDKPEVAARVAWVGAGVNLRTGAPTGRQVRRAVRRVLMRPSYRKSAERLSRQIGAAGNPLPYIVDAVETAMDNGRAAAVQQ
jgi:UDP:flavonoid glycosyltransferase YjiC (YdhE family)